MAFAARLAHEADAVAALFYGSNLRSGALDGLLDFYLLTASPPERGIWPRVSYHEWQSGDLGLRAKVATMSLATFHQAASGKLLDTTIWARFVQPCALVWHRDAQAADAVVAAIAAAAATAARLAAALGPPEGSEDAFWLCLFEATYRAELRIETTDRRHSIIASNRAHFDGLLAPALDAAGLGCEQGDFGLRPRLTPQQRRQILRWWRLRRSVSRPLNVIRLIRAAWTFEGGARYIAWKVERHSGIPIPTRPWMERHPLLAAPIILWTIWSARGRRR
ncbi:MAG: hypothetical protein N2423_04755 [Novosphingobium sp.]|nr:hypothetical protein [Novosphingobium sp.]